MSEPFDFDAYVDGLTLEPYTFTLGGQLRELPNFQSLSIQQGLDIDRGQIEQVLADVADEDLAHIIVTMPGKAADTLLDRWMKHGQVKRGESKASSRS